MGSLPFTGNSAPAAYRRPMRVLLIAMSALLGLAPPPGGRARAAEPLCLSSADAAEAVTGHKVVAPMQALRTARRAVPNAEILRAALCRDPDALVYRITVLRRGDGRILRVTVDAPSGNVVTVH